MKRNEIIELNGVEYTLELNRDSFVQIDKICKVAESLNIIYRGLYEYVDEIDDNYDPLANNVTDEDLIAELELKSKTLDKLCTRAFFIWLYPNHRLTISQVKEILKPYFEDEEKSKFIGEKVGQFLQECVQIRHNAIQQEKNLKAQINK